MKKIIAVYILLFAIPLMAQQPSLLRQVLTTNHVANPASDGLVLTSSAGVPTWSPSTAVGGLWGTNALNGSITNANGGGVSIGPGTNGAAQIYLFDKTGTNLLGGFDTNAHAGFWGPGLIWTNDTLMTRFVTPTYGSVLVWLQSSFQNNLVLSAGQTPQSSFLTSGSFNTGLGYQAMISSTGTNNTAVGYVAMNSINGQQNVAVGANALNDTGPTNNDCVAVGYNALFGLGEVDGITAVGSQSLLNDSTGIENTSLGFKSGQTVTVGSSNTFLGYLADTSAATGTNQIAIGDRATANANNDVVIGNANNSFHVTHGLLTAAGLADSTGPADSLSVAVSGPSGRLIYQLLGTNTTIINNLTTNVTFLNNVSNYIVTNFFSTFYATNINAVTVTSTTNIFNIAKGATLILTNGISFITNTWPQGPTGVVAVATNYVQNFVSLTACSITGIIGKTPNQLDSVLLSLYNTSATNWNLTLAAGINDASGLSSIVCPAGGKIEVYIEFNPLAVSPGTNCVSHVFPSTPALGGPFVRTFDIPMGGWFTNNCGNGADVTPASMLTLTNSGDTPVFTVNATTTNEIRTRFSMPNDTDFTSAIQLHTFWACSGTNSAAQSKTNIVVHYDAAAVGPGDRLDNLTFGTAVYWTNNVNPFPYEQGTEGITSALTIGNNPGKGKGVIWRIQVDGNAAGTTLTNSSLYVAHFTVEYRSIPVNTFSTPQ